MRERILPIDEEREYFFEEGCFILELSSSDDDPVLSVARARVEPGESTRRHLLEGIAERYVILEGTGRVEVGALPPAEVAPGDVVLIPPGCPQRIVNTGMTDLVFLALCTPRFVHEAYRDVDPSERCHRGGG